MIVAIFEDFLKKHNLQGKLKHEYELWWHQQTRIGEHFYLLKQAFNLQLVVVGCPAHVLHSPLQYGLDQLGAFDMD